MLNFCEYIYEKTVNDLVKNCADIDLFSVIEKGKIQLFTSFFLILNNLSYNIKMIYFFVGFYCFFGLFCILTTFKHRFEMKKPASALADAGHLSG